MFFKDHVLTGRGLHGARADAAGHGGGRERGVKEKYGIGYGGAAYAKGIKDPQGEEGRGQPGDQPRRSDREERHVSAGAAPVFYLRNKPTGEIKSFIDWVLSPEGQAIVEKVGYYPVK